MSDQTILFARSIVEGKPIRLFNHSKMRRDFTHIDDVTRVIQRLIDRVPQGDAEAGTAPTRIYNVGNHRPEELMHVVALLEHELGRKAIKDMLPMQPDLRRCRRSDARYRLQAADLDRGWDSRFRRVVSRPLQGLRHRWTDELFH